MSQTLIDLIQFLKNFDPLSFCRPAGLGADSDDEDDDDDYCDELPDNFKQSAAKQAMARSSVSAEVYGTWNVKKPFVAPKYPKTDQQKRRIIEMVGRSFLFGSLEKEDLNVVIEAMKEKKVRNGETIINQGDDGNLLYVIETGVLECYKKFGPRQAPKMVKKCVSGDTFGELALLYNCPRAASVVSVGEGVLWQLDRETFNHIVKDAAAKKREKYEKFLQSVPIFKNMDVYELSQISDALKAESFKRNTPILKQGDPGDKFYVVESGTCEARKSNGGSGIGETVYRYSSGDYFGELALQRNEPRAATVVATSDVNVLALDRRIFERLLGPLQDIMDREGAVRYK